MAGEDGAAPSVEDVNAYIQQNFGSADDAPAGDAGEQTPPNPATDPAAGDTTPPAQQQTPPEGDQQQQGEDFGVPDPDLTDLDPAARAYAEQRVLQLRQKMTEVTTEAADLRRMAESVGGVETLSALIGEIQAIQADPRGSVAQNLYNSLRQQFEAEGDSPQQAAAKAAQTVDDAAEGDLSDYDLPPEVMAKIGMVDELLEWRNSVEADRQAQAEAAARADFEARSTADLIRQWGDLEVAYPDLKGDEKAMNRIAALAHSTNGNLVQAHDMYREIVNDVRQSMHDHAANVPGGITTPPAGASNSQTPQEFDSIEDPALGAAAIEMIERLNAQQNG
jgi:hypothetical protein